MNAREYFQSYERYFWEWEDDLGVQETYPYQNTISIPNVSVIAYRGYALELLEQLAIDGIPLFGAFVLVLYAAAKKDTSGFDGVSYYLRNNNHHAYNVAEAIDFLQKVDRVNDKYKRGKNKLLLLQTIFKNAHNKVSQKDAQNILKEIGADVHLLEDCARKQTFNDTVFKNEVGVLELLNKQFPTAGDIEKAMAGLIEVPEVAEEIVEETVTADTEKDFVQLLIEEPKTFQVGALIKRIWSGLKIPIHQLSPGEQPIGGVSDMTNKGNFDQMLLSEFAYDDDLFLSRIANNETLYIKREIPPEENIFERIILIDSSIKNWGTPKVMAFATAIAITKHPRAKLSCRTVVLGGTAYDVTFDEIAQVIEGLSVVSGSLDVADTLDRYLKQQVLQKHIEIFFVSSASALKAKRLQKVLQEHMGSIKYIIATDANGSLDFFRHQNGTRKHIQKIVLPLEELWDAKPKTKARKRAADQFLPLNYPILYPIARKPLAQFILGEEYYVLSSKRSLYKSRLAVYPGYENYQPEIQKQYPWSGGGELLYESISVKTNGEYALSQDAEGVLFLYYFERRSRLLSCLNLATKAYCSITVDQKVSAPDQRLLSTGTEVFLSHPMLEYCREVIRDAGSLSLLQISEPLRQEGNAQSAGIHKRMNWLAVQHKRILTNHFHVGISSGGHLIFSDHILDIYHAVLKMKRHKAFNLRIKASREKDSFIFPDGSEVKIDPRGMLTLISSDAAIPKIYIPAAPEVPLGLSTDTGVFTGDAYFLKQDEVKEQMKIEDFYKQYIQAFINKIVTHGV